MGMDFSLEIRYPNAFFSKLYVMERFKLLLQQNNMAISPDPSVYPILTHNLMLFTCVAALHYFKAIITQQNTLGYISRGLELLFQQKHISSVLRILIFAWSH